MLFTSCFTCIRKEAWRMLNFHDVVGLGPLPEGLISFKLKIFINLPKIRNSWHWSFITPFATGDQDWSSTWGLKGIQNVMLNFLVMRITTIYLPPFEAAASDVFVAVSSRVESGPVFFGGRLIQGWDSNFVLEAFWWTNIADWNMGPYWTNLLNVYWRLWDFPPAMIVYGVA